MPKLFRYLRCWLRHRQIETDLAAELKLHRAMKQEELERRGLSTDDAHAASHRAMGNLTLAREDARYTWFAPWIESLWQDARYATRIVSRSPSFAASLVVVMSLGIGATIAVFTLIDRLILRQLPVTESDRLVYLSRPSFSYPVFEELQARSGHIFESLFAWNMEREYVEWNTDPEPTEVLASSGAFFAILGVQPALGRTFTREDDGVGGGRDGMVAVISHAAWQRRFGADASVIGRTIRVRHQPFTIIGVTPPGFFGVAPGLAPEVTIPLKSLATEDDLHERTNAWVHLMARLRKGLPLQSARNSFNGIWPAVLDATVDPTATGDRRARYLSRTTSLESGRAGYSRVRNRFEEPRWVLLALVGLLMIVATASAAHLLLARSAVRRREFAVRLAIGAGAARVMRQVLTEAFVWTVLGAAVGLVLAIWSSGVLVSMMSTWDNPIALDVTPGWRIVAVTTALAFVAAAAGAVLPAVRASGVDTSTTLKDFGQIEGSQGRRSVIGQSLVAAQVALTVLLLFGAALFGRSLRTVLAQDPGFNPDAMLIVSTDAGAARYEDARLVAFHDTLLDRLRGIVGVESASLSKYPPISDDDGAWTERVALSGAPRQLDLTREVYLNVVTPDYFRATGVQLLHGRDFADTDDEGAERVVIISDSLARALFPERSPLGQRMTMGSNEARRDLQVVGVARDVTYQRLTENPRSTAYLPRAQVQEAIEGDDLFAIVRFAGAAPTAAERVRQEIRALDAKVPLRIQTVPDRIRVSLVTERVLALIASWLGLAALALACAGLYGLLAYKVARQTNEFGIRLALGADRNHVLWMVLRQSLVVGAAGVAGGLAASLAFGQLARNLLFQVTATDAWALATASTVMFAVALVAGYIPARRASRIDPLVALRTDA